MLTTPVAGEFFYRLLIRGFVGAALAATGFGVLFNVRGKSLAAAGLTGGAGGMVYQLCLALGQSDPISNFIAAVAISILSEICARKLKKTVSTFTACALIPLVPGGTAYEMMVEFTQDNAMSGLMKMLDVATVAGMLAMGILFVSTITRFFFYSRKMLRKTRKKLSQYPLYVSPSSLRSTQLRRHIVRRIIPDRGHQKKQKPSCQKKEPDPLQKAEDPTRPKKKAEGHSSVSPCTRTGTQGHQACHTAALDQSDPESHEPVMMDPGPEAEKKKSSTHFHPNSKGSNTARPAAQPEKSHTA